MIYKNLLFSLLSIPLMISGNNHDELQQQLKESFFQKQLELSKLGRMISKKANFISSFSKLAHEYAAIVFDREVEKIESKNGKSPLSNEEKSKIKNDLLESADEFLFAFFAACETNQDITGLLSKGLFKHNDHLNIDDFELLKFHFIQSTLERRLISDLVKKYEACIKELLIIATNIENL